MTLALAQHGLDAILIDLALLFALCVAAVVFFHRLKLPPIVGFLVAGALMGPNALGLISQPELVEQLAEIGVVLLLFTVGMELSVRDLFQMRRSILVGGGLQICLTIALGAGCALVGGCRGAVAGRPTRPRVCHRGPRRSGPSPWAPEAGRPHRVSPPARS